MKKILIGIFLLLWNVIGHAQTFPVSNLQINGSVISYGGVATVANGVPVEYALLNSITQTTSISTTTIYTAATSGFYQVIVDMLCTTGGTGGTVSTTVGWNNGSAGILASTGNMSLITLGNEISQVYTVYVPAGQAITYATTVAGSAGSPQYSLRIRVLFLG